MTHPLTRGRSWTADTGTLLSWSPGIPGLVTDTPRSHQATPLQDALPGKWPRSSCSGFSRLLQSHFGSWA